MIVAYLDGLSYETLWLETEGELYQDYIFSYNNSAFRHETVAYLYCFWDGSGSG